MIKVVMGIAAFVLAGCQTHAGHPDQPAWLVDRSAHTQQELQAVISHRLPGTAVIAEDVFATRSVALFEIHHGPAHSAPAALTQPEKIRLIKRGRLCLLQFADGEEVVLRNAHCQPVKPAN